MTTPRREFLSQATLVAVSTLLAGCAGGGSDGPFAPKPPNQEPAPGTSGSTLNVTVAAHPALANIGGIAAVGSLGNKPVAVVRTGAANYTALSRICTHAGCDVGIAGGGFSCPCHGSQFDATGQATQGPAENALQRFNVVVSGDGATLTIS
jgi:cytochrome b6-f complex iron-sulfur subunit